MENLSDYKIHVKEGSESIFRDTGHLGIDVKYLDLDSLIRVYGKDEVIRFLKNNSYLDEDRGSL